MSSFLDFQATAANWLLTAQAAVGSTVGPNRNSMMAESPFTTYTVGVVVYVIAAMLLVAVLLIGGFLVVNLGMMSKRADDRLGGRAPSDVGILKDTLWPQEQEPGRTLPAEDPQNETMIAALKSQQPPSHNATMKIDMDLERKKRAEWQREFREAERTKSKDRNGGPKAA